MKIDDRWHKVEGVNIDEIRWNVPTDSVEGYPDEWAWFGEKLHFAPVPNGVYTVRLDYIKDLGLPTYQYTGGEWVFYDSELTGAGSLADSFTNDWIKNASELIDARARWFLWTNYYKSDENADRAKATELDALSVLRKETDVKKADMRREAFHI